MDVPQLVGEKVYFLANYLHLLTFHAVLKRSFSQDGVGHFAVAIYGGEDARGAVVNPELSGTLKPLGEGKLHVDDEIVEVGIAAHGWVLFDHLMKGVSNGFVLDVLLTD